MTAGGALVEVSAQRGRAATHDRVDDLRLVRPQIELVTVRAEEGRKVEPRAVAAGCKRRRQSGSYGVSRREATRR